MSCYSIDFRRKIIEAYEQEKKSIRELAKRFLVSADTVRRLIKQYRETGDLTPQKCGSRQKSVLSQYEEKVLEIVEAHPDYTLWQYCEVIREEIGIDVSTSMMGRFCIQHNLTLKKNLSQRKSSNRRGARITSRILAED